MKSLAFLFILIFSFNLLAAGDRASSIESQVSRAEIKSNSDYELFKAPIEKLIRSVIERTEPGKSLFPKYWSHEQEGKVLDLRDLCKFDFEDGRAFGATGSKIVDHPLKDILQAFAKPGSMFKFGSQIKTLKDLEKIGESDNPLDMRIAIVVPVLENFHTRIEIKNYDDGHGRYVMEWRQKGGEGDISYTQGAVIVEGDGDRTKVFVIGTHVLKPERKIEWLMRSSAAAFGRTHYGNFISAVEALLDNPDVNH